MENRRSNSQDGPWEGDLRIHLHLPAALGARRRRDIAHMGEGSRHLSSLP